MSLRRLLIIAIGAVVVVLVGYAASRQSRGPRSSLANLPAREYSGHFTSGPGASWFRPCGAAPADSAWWVTVTGSAGTQMDSLRRAARISTDAPSFVRWMAAVTTGGEVGPRGAGVPALLVRQVLEMRPVAASDCTSP